MAAFVVINRFYFTLLNVVPVAPNEFIVSLSVAEVIV